MKCPHCLVEYYQEFDYSYIGRDNDGSWGIRYAICPNPKCNRIIITLIEASWLRNSKGQFRINTI